MAVAAQLHSIPFAQAIPRVYSILKLDERRDNQMRCTTRSTRCSGTSTRRRAGTRLAARRRRRRRAASHRDQWQPVLPLSVNVLAASGTKFQS